MTLTGLAYQHSCHIDPAGTPSRPGLLCARGDTTGRQVGTGQQVATGQFVALIQITQLMRSCLRPRYLPSVLARSERPHTCCLGHTASPAAEAYFSPEIDSAMFSE